MSFQVIKKLPTPEEIKEQFPVPSHLVELKMQRDKEIRDVITGKSNKFYNRISGGIFIMGDVKYLFIVVAIALVSIVFAWVWNIGCFPCPEASSHVCDQSVVV